MNSLAVKLLVATANRTTPLTLPFFLHHLICQLTLSSLKWWPNIKSISKAEPKVPFQPPIQKQYGPNVDLSDLTGTNGLIKTRPLSLTMNFFVVVLYHSRHLHLNLIYAQQSSNQWTPSSWIPYFLMASSDLFNTDRFSLSRGAFQEPDLDGLILILDRSWA